MPENFSKITVNLYNTVVILNPVNYFYITDNPRRVIIYEISYKDNNPISLPPGSGLGVALSTPPIKLCRIPYYESDGHTNMLRANMLYPFMCFKLEGCPSSPQECEDALLGNGGLLKYNIGRNIDTSRIQRYVEEEVVKIMGPSGPKILEKINKESGGRVGLPSVLPRLTNFVDYLIAITSLPVVNFTPDQLMCYRPVYEGDKFDMTNCDRRHLGSSTPYGEHDLYRHKILESLKDQIIMLSTYGIIHREETSLARVDITMHDFNNTVGIATRFAENVENVSKYGEISNDLHKNVKMFVEGLKGLHGFDILRKNLMDSGRPDIGDTEKSRGKFMHFFNEMGRLLIEPIYNAPFDELLATNIRGWKCAVPPMAGGSKSIMISYKNCIFV